MHQKKERKNRSEDQGDGLTGVRYLDENPRLCCVGETEKAPIHMRVSLLKFIKTPQNPFVF
jgi:hypothetical protein